MRIRCYSIVLALAALGALGASGQVDAARPGPLSQTPSEGPTASFTIFVQGNPIGTEQATVVSGPDGWTIRATGRIGVPVNLTTSRFELRYDRDWHPVSLAIESSLRGQPLIMSTTFSGGTAASNVTQAGQQIQKTDQVASDTLVLPNMFFAAYEALALRLPSVKPGTQLKAYILPQVEVPITVGESSDQRITTAERTIAARRYNLTVQNPDGPLAVEVWTDENSRLIRLRAPSQSLEVAREDVASVSARTERMARAGDEQVRIPSVGFTLAATVSKPAGADDRSGPFPAVVLLPGSGSVDRDENVAGIPIFAEIANALADAGFLVVRYDKRGIGQSGGRDEAATLNDYSEDARAVVKYVEKRKDVDKRRITLLGHSEGGLVAMLTARQEKKKVAAVVLVGTPGTSGGELVLEQQQHQLDGMNLSEAEKQNRIDLQKRIQAAVVSGTGWEGIPEAYRKQADTPWFRSFLAFDPDKAMEKVEQPLAVFQGAKDRQVPVRHAYRLIELAKARKKSPAADLYIIDGLNHLMVSADTGEVSEYPSLKDKHVSATFMQPLVDWIRRATGGQAEAR